MEEESAKRAAWLEQKLMQGFEDRRNSPFRTRLFNRLGSLVSLSELSRVGMSILISDCRESYTTGVPLAGLSRSAGGDLLIIEFQYPPNLSWVWEQPGEGVFGIDGARIAEAKRFQRFVYSEKEIGKSVKFRKAYIRKFGIPPEGLVVES